MRASTAGYCHCAQAMSPSPRANQGDELRPGKRSIAPPGHYADDGNERRGGVDLSPTPLGACSRPSDEVFGEGAQDAGDAPLLFHWEVAAVDVGDGRRPLVDSAELRLVTPAGSDAGRGRR